MGRRAAITLFAIALALPPVRADDLPLQFDDPGLQSRYTDLIAELRCLVCQNQSLADSHAPLAQDLREQVHERIRGGQSDEQIIEFLVARYGDFVLYRPPLRFATAALWFGPLLFLLAAAYIVVRVSRRRAARPAPLSDAERERLRDLMDPPAPP